MRISQSPAHRIGFIAKMAGLSVFAYLGTTGVYAKDLYVSPSGNDSVSYTANSIASPWKTFNYALYNIKAGDRLYVRGGTYTPTYPLWMDSDYSNKTYGGDPSLTMRAESGTSSAPVIVENYPNEIPIINLANVSAATYINLDNKSYWTFRGLTFSNSDVVFAVGQNFPTRNNTFDGLKITANRGGDNHGGISIWNGNGEYTTIKNCVIKGPGQNVHLNTAAIYLKAVNNVKILNNVLSDAPIGVYFKHRNTATSASQVDIELAYNYIFNTTRESLGWNALYAHIHDNVFGANTAALHLSSSDGGAGGDYNKIEHNTFLDESIYFEGSNESGDPFPGSIGNTVSNNVFRKTLSVMEYSSAPSKTIWGKNLLPSTSSLKVLGGFISIPLGSLLGNPTFVGGSTPTSLSGFTLANSSLGYRAATDGKDLGADIAAMVGGSSSPTAPAVSPPSSPSSIIIQAQ